MSKKSFTLTYYIYSYKNGSLEMRTPATQLHGKAWNTFYFLLKRHTFNTMSNFNLFIAHGITNLAEQITNPLEQIINLVEQITNPVKQITNLVEQIINPVEQITNMVEQIINRVEQITNLVEQIINLLEQITNSVFSFWD